MFERIFCVALFVPLLFFAIDCFEIQPRIVNGFESELGQFPYFALLEIKTRYSPKDMESLCGGTLLSEEFILTAAHCLENASKVLIHLGSLRKMEYEEGRHVFFARRKHFHIHPEWNAENNVNDIALIKLPRPAVFSDLIQPVNLPTKCDLYAGKEMIAIGNGYDANDGEIADILQYTVLTAIPHWECEEFYGFYDGSSIICAKGYFNNSICQVCKYEIGH